MESPKSRIKNNSCIDETVSITEETELVVEEEEANDTTFTLSIAQKCAARAALHLGIETVTTDVLYVLADALLLYMERIGSFISHFVERDGYSDNLISEDRGNRRYSSNGSLIDDSSDFSGANISKRWSGHVNIFDLLHGIESLASHAENQLEIDNSINVNNVGTSITRTGATGSHLLCSHWESLAEFLFGKDWYKIDVTKIQGLALTSNGNENRGITVGSGDAKKQAKVTGNNGSKSAGKKIINTQNRNDDKNNKVEINGWNAPFPEEVPQYPIRKQFKSLDSFVTANHACHDSRIPVIKRFNQDKANIINGYDNEVDQSIPLIPDHVFLDGITSFWGTTATECKQAKSSMTESTKETFDKDTSNNMDIDLDASQASTSSSSKRKRTGNNDNMNPSKTARSELDNEKEKADTSENILPPYVPEFFPPFPPSQTYHQPSASKIQSSSRLINSLNRNGTIESSKTNIQSKSQRIVNYKPLPSQFEHSQQGSNIRAALVSLRQNTRNSYWGEIDDGNTYGLSINALQVKTSKIRSFDDSNATVADSRNTESSAAGGIVSVHGPSAPVVPIKPMTKASSARVSRILEGSME